MRTIAIIPAYNEADSIADVVRDTLTYVDKVVVVNDQSEDSTEAQVASIGSSRKVDCITTCGKRGAGNALITGIEYVERKYDAKNIVLLDGDGQHDPAYIPSMLEKLECNDMVITSRFMDKLVFTKMPSYRKFGIWMITTAYNFGAKFKVKDSQCGMRALRASKLHDLNLQERGFGYSTEMLVKARAQGYKIAEIPTVVKYHTDFKKNSTMNPLVHGVNVMLMTLKWRIICER